MYIVGGRILTMAGREIPEGILQIRNGKIAQVGARGEVKLQPEEGEQVVIAKNALIMPGIIEAHCHMGIMEEKKSTEGDDCNETVIGTTKSSGAFSKTALPTNRRSLSMGRNYCSHDRTRKL